MPIIISYLITKIIKFNLTIYYPFRITRKYLRLYSLLCLDLLERDCLLCWVMFYINLHRFKSTLKFLIIKFDFYII